MGGRVVSRPGTALAYAHGRSQGVSLTFDITHWPRFLEIKHVGRTTYADRLDGLRAIAEFSAAHSDRKPVLINFLDADVVIESATEPDYMLQATTHPFFTGRSVALIGISREAAAPAITAASIRGVEIRVFATRADAVEWLRGEQADAPASRG